MRALLFIPVFLTAILWSSCTSLNRLVEEGNYDRAVRLAVKRLQGDKKKSPEQVRALEAAFRKANARDLASANRLRAEGLPSNWEQIHIHYRAIEERQALVAPLMPLRDKFGYRATIHFVDVSAEELEARKRAASYLYARSERLLGQARQGDRLAAREAYDMLRKTERYFRDFRDREHLLTEALELGRTHVLVEVTEDYHGYISPFFWREISDLRLGRFSDRWEVYHFEADARPFYHYRAQLVLQRLDVSPERVDRQLTLERRDVEDGWEYVKDEHGQIVTDSSGNRLKETLWVEVKAEVMEVRQYKAADVEADFILREGASGALVHRQRLTARAEFSHEAVTFRGDERALSQDNRCRIGGSPQPFPSDADLLITAAQELKNSFLRLLRNRREIV